ncbi:hypothetical protein [Paracoccus versutus]|uniref:hypothetical protein n=1 Tax=Paracoccus versutus TaxID=34007 RepID=UPI000DF7F422|nr:hypothetical protein [Paracoccus versutus]RDD72296.1 hypothetical protein DVR11_06485 [Paracoccus versutus]
MTRLGSIFDEVVELDMVGLLGAQADTSAVIEPAPVSLWLSVRLTPSLPRDLLVIDHPARSAEPKFGDLAIAVAAMAEGPRNHRCHNSLIIQV